MKTSSTMYIGLILDFAEEFFPVPQGEFMSRDHPTEAPFSPPPLPDVSETDRMTYFWLSEYMANTASYVYQKAGAFKHTLTPENAKVGPTGICHTEVLYYSIWGLLYDCILYCMYDYVHVQYALYKSYVCEKRTPVNPDCMKLANS